MFNDGLLYTDISGIEMCLKLNIKYDFWINLECTVPLNGIKAKDYLLCFYFDKCHILFLCQQFHIETELLCLVICELCVCSAVCA